MKQLFDDLSGRCSQIVTTSYSTSFSLAIRLLHKDFVKPIYAIYGFVRFADEIVDSFHQYDKRKLLERFSKDTFEAIDEGISLNPILNSFQATVNKFAIEPFLIQTFLDSMQMDLEQNIHNRESYQKYILGSSEVVGLMCLKVFCEGNSSLYETLKPFAMRLGAAFQKINFLRDINDDQGKLGRFYFPELDFGNFDSETKIQIEKEIRNDFSVGLNGIRKLPRKSRFGVYAAYIYYYSLLKKIESTPAQVIQQTRVRISDKEKYALLAGAYFRHSFNLV
jgi:phytoene/squalene synthetase